MSGFHNTPEGPKRCSASKRPCKYAQAGQEHFETKEAAEAAYAKFLQEEHGAVATVKRLSEEARRAEATFFREGGGGLIDFDSSDSFSPQVITRLEESAAARQFVEEGLEGSGLLERPGLQLVNLSSGEDAKEWVGNALAKRDESYDEEGKKLTPAGFYKQLKANRDFQSYGVRVIEIPTQEGPVVAIVQKVASGEASIKKQLAECKAVGDERKAAQAAESNYRTFVQDSSLGRNQGCTPTSLAQPVEKRLQEDEGFRRHVLKQLEAVGLAHHEGTRLVTYASREQVLAGLESGTLDAYGDSIEREVSADYPSSREASVFAMLGSGSPEVQAAARAAVRRYSEQTLEELKLPGALEDYGQRFAEVNTPEGVFVLGIEATGEAGNARGHLQALGK